MSVPLSKLLDGHLIPQLAFGTGTALFQQSATAPVLAALRAGFSHVDCAQAYGNEASVGEAIAGSGLEREKVYVTTKLNRSEAVGEALRESLAKLRVEYVDLFLIHMPTVFDKPGQLERVWKGMEQAKEEGLARSVGVSNFRIIDFERVLSVAKHKPVVNQIEFHPYVQQQLLPLLKLQQEHGIRTMSYGGLSPITRRASGPLLPVLKEIGQRLGATEVQVLMKWLEQKGVVAVTTTSKEQRLQQYLGAYTLPSLSEEDVRAIDEAGAHLHSRHFAGHMEAL